MELRSAIHMHGWKTPTVKKQWYVKIKNVWGIAQEAEGVLSPEKNLQMLSLLSPFVSQAFVEEQNKLTMPYLEQCAVRAQFQQRLTELYDYPKYSCPYKRGKRY